MFTSNISGLALYRNCLFCPRACGVDRLAGVRGFCGETAELRVAAAVLHRGEEPPLSGKGGSGAIFIGGCNLGCVFCQNYQISQGPLGRLVSIDEFSRICLALQDRGAENINIVTGSHAVPAVILGIIAARSASLRLPVLWNSSAYESPETLDLLRDHVDMYLPDLKTLDSDTAARFFRAPDYPQIAAAAILKMIEMRSGKVIIRHLILPGRLDSTRSVLRWFAEHAKGKALLSLMTQYTPVKRGSGRQPGGAPGRFLSEAEYETVLGWLGEYGIEDGFCQEPVTGSGWLPDFNRENPFSSGLSTTVWNWKEKSSILG
jgi:putative pyruvate formate lyase activating enzyme